MMEQSKQQILQVPPFQQVEPFTQANIELYEIHDDIEEEKNTTTFHVDVFTSMTSSATTTQLSGSIFYSSFS